MQRRIVTALAGGLALVMTACGSGSGGPSLLGGATTTREPAATTTGRAPTTSTAGATTTTGRATTTTVQATTTTVAPLRVIDTRNPEVVDAKKYLRGEESFGSAITLPDKAILLAYRTSQFDLCTAAIDRVDPATGARTRFADGADPQVSPDGRLVVYANLRRVDAGGSSCSVLEPAIRELSTGATRVVAFGRDSTAGAVAFGHRWSPDGRFVTMTVGFDFSESAGSALVDVEARTVVAARLARDLEIELNGKVGAPADEPWQLYPHGWLSDGTIAAGATCCYGQQLIRDAIPQWWRVGTDGLVRSRADAITDPAVLAQLPRTVFG